MSNKIKENFKYFKKDFNTLYKKILKKLEYKDIKNFFKEGFYVGQAANDFNLFDYSISPWILDFLNFWKNNKIKWFYLIQGSQTSKTTFLQGFLLYHLIFELDCPIMYIVDTGINLSRYISTKIAPLLDANEKRYNINMLTNSKFDLYGGTKNYGIKGMFTKGINSGSRITHYLIGLNPIYFAIGSMGNLVKSESARLIIGDEVNNWKIGIKQAQIRTRIYGDRGRGVFASIPPNEGNKEFWLNIMNSNVYQWWVPCPYCNKFQSWTEKNIDIKKKEIICIHCNKPFPKEKSERKRILNQGKLVCVDYKNRTYKQIEPKKDCDSVSLHIPGFYSLFTNWDEQINNYLDFISNKISDIDKITYVKEELAILPDIADGEQLNLECVKTYLTKNTYKVEELDLITIGFDVQMKELYYCVSGWKYLKKENKIVIHILDANIIQWKTNNGEVIFKKVLKFISDWAKTKKLIQVVFDLTDGKITHEILTQINYLEPNIFGIKDIGSGYNKSYKDETQAIISKNKEHNRLYLAVSSALKDIIYENFKELHNGIDYSKTWAINNGVHKKFCYSLTQEWRQVYTSTTGQERFRWRKIKERGCYNHFLSALAYSIINFNKLFHHLYQQYNFTTEYYLTTDKMEEINRRNGKEKEQQRLFS